jgi:hypothetical protein
MSVPIQGWVQFHNEMPVTNEQCCSDSRVQCEKCAAGALLQSGVNVNMEVDEQPLTPPSSFVAVGGPIFANTETTETSETSEEVTAVSQEITTNVPVDEEPLTPALFFGAVGGPVSPSQQQQPAAPSTPTEALNRMYAEDMERRMARNARGLPKRQPVEQPVTNEGEETPLLPVTAAQHGY